MAQNVTFQTTVATPPVDTIVGALEVDGIKYQKMLEAYDYRFYYYNDDGKMEYLCEHVTYGTATSATDWRITKMEYDAVTGSITFRGTQSGSLDGRVALFA